MLTILSQVEALGLKYQLMDEKSICFSDLCPSNGCPILAMTIRLNKMLATVTMLICTITLGFDAGNLRFDVFSIPLSGDYTPSPQDEIDESLYVYGKKWDPKSLTQCIRVDRSVIFYLSISMDWCRIIGTYTEHLLILNLRFHEVYSEYCDYYEKKMAREAKFKKQRVFNNGNGVAKPVWTNANRVNHTNPFIPRSVQLNAGRPNINSVRPNVNIGRTNVNHVRLTRVIQVVCLGSAVKTSAGYNWRNTSPNSNCNGGPISIITVNAKGPQDRPKPEKAWVTRINWRILNNLMGDLLPLEVAMGFIYCAADDNPRFSFQKRVGKKLLLKQFRSETGIFDDGMYDEVGVITDFNSLTNRRNLKRFCEALQLKLGSSHAKRSCYSLSCNRQEGIDWDKVFLDHSGKNRSYQGFYVSQLLALFDLRSPMRFNRWFHGFVCDCIQAPRAWYATLSTFLEKYGYKRGTIDKTLFIKRDKKDIMLIQVYVDDIIFRSTKKSWCDEFQALMQSRFQISSMGELTFFLRLQVKQNTEDSFISQGQVSSRLRYQKFDLVSVKTAITTMETKVALTKDKEDVDVDVTPKTSHLNALKRIFKYLKGKPNLGLWYPRESPFDLEAFSDSRLWLGLNLDREINN
ncbi:putative ribonuclease H-like domain-containing protein [Tanacetum coccineum]